MAAAFQLHPTRTAADARRYDCYVLENDEHDDVPVARSVPTLHGLPVDFEGLSTAVKPSTSGRYAFASVAGRPDQSGDASAHERMVVGRENPDGREATFRGSAYSQSSKCCRDQCSALVRRWSSGPGREARHGDENARLNTSATGQWRIA